VALPFSGVDETVVAGTAGAGLQGDTGEGEEFSGMMLRILLAVAVMSCNMVRSESCGAIDGKARRRGVQVR
jgi:DNA invertase Pin-like site-specific DNA recombinase